MAAVQNFSEWFDNECLHVRRARARCTLQLASVHRHTRITAAFGFLVALRPKLCSDPSPCSSELVFKALAKFLRRLRPPPHRCEQHKQPCPRTSQTLCRRTAA